MTSTAGRARAEAPRIAFFTNLYPTVSHSFIRREILALEALGWEVHRFSLRHGHDIVDDQDRRERERTRALLPLRLGDLAAGLRTGLARPARLPAALAATARMAWVSERGLLRSLFYLVEAVALLGCFRRARIQHAHAHFGTNPAAVLRLVRALGGPPYSFTNHAPFDLEPPVAWSLADKVRDAAFAVAISRLGRAQLLRVTDPELWGKVHEVRCGLDLATAAEPAPVPDVPRLLCIARLSPEKGHLVLVQALGQLRSEGCDARLDLAGDGPLRPALEREIAAAGLGDVVRLHGSVDEATIAKLLETSRALVAPSLTEGLPVVLMECYRAARPAIASNVGAISELVEPGVSGWLVPPADPEALAGAMRAALSTPVAELTQMGRAGRATVLERHDSAKEARRLAALIDASLRSARGRD